MVRSVPLLATTYAVLVAVLCYWTLEYVARAPTVIAESVVAAHGTSASLRLPRYRLGVGNMSEGNRRDDDRIPTWNGDVNRWQRYKDETRLWLLGENLNVDHLLSARLIARLQGAPRQACINMSQEELLPEAPEGTPAAAAKSKRQELGVTNVLKRLE